VVTFLIGSFILLILAVLLTLVGSLIAGVVLAARTVRHLYGIVPMLLVVALFLAMPVGAWKYSMHRHALGHLPEALDISTVSFRAEERWGFPGLPSGMEFGLLVYALPERQATLVARDGAGYLERLPYRPRSNNSLRGRFSNWRETPMPHLPLVSSRLCDFEDCPDVPARLVEQINRLAARPGSYYARGRHGTIVVSPAERLVLFMY
jgi:hypothetical protein